MSLFFAVSTPRFFFVSPTLFIRPDDPRVFAPHDYHTIPTSIHSPHRPHRHHSARFAFFSLSSIHYGTYPENPTRLISSRAQVLQYLSFPPQPYLSTPDPKSEQHGSPKETFSPLFGCLPRGPFVAWPHRSCLRSLRCASLLRHE